MTVSTKKKRSSSSLIILALFLLLNPNISIIDYLPDFISYFILAKLFLDASDRAPFFKEARSAFLKLGWLNLLKIPAIFLIAQSRGGAAYGNDTISIASFVFAVLEVILMIIAIRNIFDGLFRLGERTSASALISDFKITKRKSMTADALKTLTYAFAIIKCACYGLPDMLLLTTMRENAHGMQIITIDPKYPIVLLLTQVIGFAVGILWFRRMKKYAKSVIKEGQFNSALLSISDGINIQKIESMKKAREIKAFITLLTASVIFMFELRLDNLRSVNLIPPTLFAILIFISVFAYRKYITSPTLLLIVTALYAISSSVAYVIEFNFLNEYGYDYLLETKNAAEKYVPVNISTIISTVILLILIILITLMLRNFILRHTGISKDSENYGKLEKEYHGSLLMRTYIFSAIAILTAVFKCVYVISSGNTQWVFTDINDVTMPVITAPSVEWIGFATSAASIALILYSIYYFSTLKDEVEMKYAEE